MRTSDGQVTHTNPATRAGYMREGEGWDARASPRLWEGIVVWGGDALSSVYVAAPGSDA